MEVRLFLRSGYRRQNPRAIPAAPPTAVTPEMEARLVNVNNCSLKDLAGLPGSSMLVANVIKSKRPFQAVEDLIEAITEVNWVAIEHKLTF